jgi:hypothetical protein
MSDLYEININGKWIKSSEYVFRSWTGSRCLNGKVYQGPRFSLGTDNECNPNQQCVDLCSHCGLNFVQHMYGILRNEDINCPDCNAYLNESSLDGQLVNYMSNIGWN